MLYFKVRKQERLTFIVIQEEKRNKTREHEKAIPVVDQKVQLDERGHTPPAFFRL